MSNGRDEKRSQDSDEIRCFCFGVTVDDLRRDGPGRIAFVKGMIAAGRCDCARLNPSGRCCLGDLYQAVAGCRA